MYLVLELPAHRASIAARARAFLGRPTRRDFEALEEERSVLLEGLEIIQRAHHEQRALFESLPDMVVLHVDGKIVYANRAFVRTLGWNALDEIVGKPLADFIDPRSRREVMERVARPDAPRSSELTQAWFSTRTNKPIRVEIAPTRPVVFGGALGWLIVGRDIEERVRLQERLAAADRLAALGLLAAGVAHEINNPLAYVLNNIEIARSQIALLGPPAEGALEALKVALDGVDRIRFIVRELLSLSRGDTRTLGPTDVREVIESMLSLARVELAKKAKLVVELGNAPLAHASASLVSQIFVNLVLNAIQAMESSDTDANVLTVRLGETDGGDVLIEVSDTGIGIPEHELQRIFEPFYTTKATGKGTGLGLAITQRIVHELDGEITVTSAPGRGSTFRVTLPAAHEEDETFSPAEARPA
jgi:PAS domain S-box-containing protein